MMETLVVKRLMVPLTERPCFEKLRLIVAATITKCPLDIEKCE